MNNQSIKAIIFDCDGTLIDSEEAHLAGWRQVAKHFEFELTADDYHVCIGNPDTVIAEKIVERKRGISVDKILAKKREYFSEYQRLGLPPIAGTVSFLDRLIQVKDQLGLKLALASAAFKNEILLNLKALRLENAFDVVLSGQDDLHEYEDPKGVNKPSPYIYLHSAKLLGVSPSECIVIEDSYIGVTAGASAGCLTVAIPNSYSKNHDFSRASLIVETLSDYGVEHFLETAMRSRG
jgi:HAD superfamily hydrolase (TIGR01509 family)